MSGPKFDTCQASVGTSIVSSPYTRPGTFEVIGKVLDELERARAKHPPNGNQHGAYAVVHEELDEAWDAVKKDWPLQAKAEMIQVAAMAIRFVLET